MNHVNINALTRDLIPWISSSPLPRPLSLFRPPSLSFSLAFRFKWAITSLVVLTSKFCHLEESFPFTRRDSTNGCTDYTSIMLSLHLTRMKYITKFCLYRLNKQSRDINFNPESSINIISYSKMFKCDNRIFGRIYIHSYLASYI